MKRIIKYTLPASFVILLTLLSCKDGTLFGDAKKKPPMAPQSLKQGNWRLSTRYRS